MALLLLVYALPGNCGMEDGVKWNPRTASISYWVVENCLRFCITPEALCGGWHMWWEDEKASEVIGQRNVKRPWWPWSIFINTERRRCSSLIY